MARRPVPLRGAGLAGAAAAAFVLAATLGPLAAVAARSGLGASVTAADWAAVRFSVTQAALSSAISVALAIPLARALARRRFRGRGLVIALLGAPFLLPVIVAVLGLLAVFGRNGLLNAALGAVGIAPVSIYGLQGVVLAHVFFNLPLATRLILQGWLAIPAERFRLAATLGVPAGRILERPMLRDVLPGAALVIFLVCLSSFAVALTLGGGPKATTVELAIFQALRFDFEPSRAALLASVQAGLCLVALAASGLVRLPQAMGAGLDRTVERWDARGMPVRVLDALMIGLACLFLLLPLAMVVARGAGSILALPPEVWSAALRSVAVALISAFGTVVLALSLAVRGGWVMSVAGVLPLAVSSMVLGTGLFLMARPFVSPLGLALPVTVLVNMLMSLPFAVRALGPAVEEVERGHGRLADTLGIMGWARLRLLLLPRLRRPLGFAAGLAAALSMGDLGVIALFAGEGQATLPLMMYRLMGAYRMDEAAGAALLLVALSLGLFWLFDRGGRANAPA